MGGIDGSLLTSSDARHMVDHMPDTAAGAPVSNGGPRASLGSRFRSLRDQVVDDLRERIIEGSLAPGHRLVERDLSEELEVSRITIREALQILAAEGLVTINARRGAAVSPFGEPEIRNLLELRLALETLAARLAAIRHTPAHAEILTKVVGQGRVHTKARDSRAASAANLGFHEAVGLASENPLLVSHLEGLRSQLRRLFRMTPQLQSNHVDDHNRILDAILDRDADRAEKLSLAHLQQVMDQTMELFRA